MTDYIESKNQVKNDKKSYSYSDRKKISARIKNIKKKEDYVRLFKIINRDSNNKFTENSNGIWLDLKILEDETIYNIDKFLKKILDSKNNLTDSVNSIEYVPYSTDEVFVNSGPKLSNYEKSILRRHKYSDKEKNSN